MKSKPPRHLSIGGIFLDVPMAKEAAVEVGLEQIDIADSGSRIDDLTFTCFTALIPQKASLVSIEGCHHAGIEIRQQQCHVPHIARTRTVCQCVDRDLSPAVLAT